MIYNNVIMDADDIIGFSWDIKACILQAIKDGEIEENDDLTAELLQALDAHDGLVVAHYHPMGAWHVADLVEA